MRFLGDFAEDQTVYCYFTTSTGGGGAVAPSSAFEVADVIIYKDGSATQKTTANGITMTSPFDSIVGLHLVSIDTSNDTGDTNFWQPGHDYTLVLSPDETVDSQTIVSVLGQFAIENRGNAGFRRAVRCITRGTVGTGSTVTNVVTSSLDPNPAVTDQFKGLIIAWDKDTTTAALRGQKSDITGSAAGGGSLTVTSLTTAPQSGDTFVIE